MASGKLLGYCAASAIGLAAGFTFAAQSTAIESREGDFTLNNNGLVTLTAGLNKKVDFPGDTYKKIDITILGTTLMSDQIAIHNLPKAEKDKLAEIQGRACKLADNRPGYRQVCPS